MYACAARLHRNAPLRCTPITVSQSSSDILKSRLSRVTPALLTRISSRPKWLAVLSTASCTIALSATFRPPPVPPCQGDQVPLLPARSPRYPHLQVLREHPPRPCVAPLPRLSLALPR